MEPVRRIDGEQANSVKGVVRYDIPKLLWNLGMTSCALVFAPLTFGFSVVILFLTVTYFSLLIGHSAGMHRLMIHRAYECHAVVEKFLIYIGVLVGMSGPLGIIKIHDLRDWAQRQKECHDFFSHKQSYLKDIWWQLTSRFEFDCPPKLKIEAKFQDDDFYQWLEKTWRYHQVVLGLILYFIGGWAFVVWGVFVRVSVSIIGHWTITYICHNPGAGDWRVRDAAVQASNIRGLGVLTYGECWHNNHHAFPESARIGIEKGQSDPTWRFIQFLAYLGLAKNIGVPRANELQDDLYKAN
jgi:stearoyl-CoA desaturase (delta-9 desaturase)